MAILRNIQIARRYNITPATVGNWIEQTKHRKINLKLTTVKGKFYIEDTEENHQEINRLKQQGLKFRSKSGETLKITPDPRIYEIFTDDQLISLYTNIAYYNLIPVKFSYFAEGAKYQDDFYKEAFTNESSFSNMELDTIDRNLPSVLKHFSNGDIVNIIEFGTGNSSNIVKLLSEDLISQEKFGNYISICSSSKMLELRKKDFNSWTDLGVKAHKVDIEEQVVRNILFKEKDGLKTRNLCIALQSFLGNVRNQVGVLENLSESISDKDYLLVGVSIKSEENSNMKYKPNKDRFYKKHRWLLDFLGISDYVTFEDSEVSANNVNKCFILKQDLILSLDLNGKEYSLFLERDQKITYFISMSLSLQDYINQFNLARFSVEQFSISSDHRYGLFLLKPHININY